MASSFTIIDHPSDLGIEAAGNDLREVFEAAAEGLMSVIVDTATIECIETRRVRLTGSGEERLLVKWLSEVLYLYDGERFVGKEFSVRDLTPSSVTAEISGERFSRDRHTTRVDVKAVTYHQLEIRRTGRKCTARVFLDI